MQGRFLFINFESADDYLSVQKFLLKENVQFQSYVLEDGKPLKVSVPLRGLRLNSAVHDIKSILELEDFVDVMVTQMYRGHIAAKIYIPLFHISIPKQADVERIFNITDIMDTEVSFQNYWG